MMLLTSLRRIFGIAACALAVACNAEAPNAAHSPSYSQNRQEQSVNTSSSTMVGMAAEQITPRQLPPEARETLVLIRQGGPFPYERDGVVFGNFEKLLPKQARGYYHEYTVRTPGAKNRGTRRIIAGGNPPTEFYYTDDHYQSFRRIVEK